ncbi:MAG: tetratricopeptide repeat protein [Alicyclobacillus sp.]|nr:tetratricopeptide repeat protein [Alicyclobacillus sp.]
MFDTAFAMLFRAVDRIRRQLETADAELRPYLGEELRCLQQLGEQVIDRWMALDEQITELLHSYHLDQPDSAQPPLQLAAHPAAMPVSGLEAAPDSRTAQIWEGKAPTATVPLPAPPLTSSGSSSVPWTDLAFDFSHPVAVAFRRGLGYFDLHLFSDAAQALEQVMAAAEAPLARLYLAACYAADGRPSDALAVLQPLQAIAGDPLLTCAVKEVEAHACLQLGRTDAAVRALTQITTTLPKYPDAWFNLGLCCAKQGAYDTAETYVARAWALDPRDDEAASVLVTLQLWRGDPQTAAETCRAALQRWPRHRRLLLLHAHVLRALGHLEQSRTVCRQVTRLYPHDAEAWSLWAWLALQADRPHEAVAALKKRLALVRQDDAALVQLGIAMLFCGDHARAERVLTHCLAHYPNKSLIWIALGKISFDRGHREQAHVRFLRASKDARRPVRRLALYYYGLALLDAGEAAAAERYLKAAAAAGPPNQAILTALARTAERLGRPLEAEKLYRRARDLQPQSAP